MFGRLQKTEGIIIGNAGTNTDMRVQYIYEFFNVIERIAII